MTYEKMTGAIDLEELEVEAEEVQEVSAAWWTRGFWWRLTHPGKIDICW